MAGPAANGGARLKAAGSWTFGSRAVVVVIVRSIRHLLALAALIVGVAGCGGRAAHPQTTVTGNGAQRSGTATLPPATATAVILRRPTTELRRRGAQLSLTSSVPRSVRRSCARAAAESRTVIYCPPLVPTGRTLIAGVDGVLRSRDFRSGFVTNFQSQSVKVTRSAPGHWTIAEGDPLALRGLLHPPDYDSHAGSIRQRPLRIGHTSATLWLMPAFGIFHGVYGDTQSSPGGAAAANTKSPCTATPTARGPSSSPPRLPPSSRPRADGDRQALGHRAQSSPTRVTGVRVVRWKLTVDKFEHRSDQELLEHAAHEPEAFGAFYRRHVGGVLAFFRRRTGDSQLALDLTAETFARALEHTDSFRAMAQPPGAWLYAIARNLLTDSYRRGRVADDARQRLALEPLIVTDLGFERVENAADAASELGAVDLDEALSADQADAVRARVLEDQSYEQIAAQLRCSPQVARQHVSARAAQPQTTLGEARMITDDPIRDLEHQLVAAAARENVPHPTPPRRRARRRTLALPAVGALAAAAIALIVLLGNGASAPSLAQAAYAQLNPKDGVIALEYDTRFLDGGRLHQHVRAEISYSSIQARSVSTSIGPRSGRAVHFLEEVETAREIRSYESGSRTLTIQATCQRSGAFPRSTTGDLIARFNPSTGATASASAGRPPSTDSAFHASSPTKPASSSSTSSPRRPASPSR